MDVFWLEQSEADVPADDDWLSESEAAHLSSLRIPKRHADWRLGRWTAKCAAAATPNFPGNMLALKDIQVRAASTGEPEVSLPGNAAAITISISHCAGLAVCAVALGKVALGCDLEAIESRSDAFIADYFTPEERKLIAQSNARDRSFFVTLLWSAKESALKALHVGLRADTRSVVVSLVDSQSEPLMKFDWRAQAGSGSEEATNASGKEWCPLQVRCTDGTEFQGWWQRTADAVRTMVAAPLCAPPIQLRAVVRPATTAMSS